MSNADALRAIMQAHDLNRPAVARLAMVSINTVDAWLAPPGAAWGRNINDRHIEAIKLRLARRGDRP